MKVVFVMLALLLGNSLCSFSQVPDNAIERLMTNRIEFTCDDIAYNSVILIPRLYRENKMDTLDAVVNYWTGSCGMSEPAVSYIILNAIKNYSFSERLYRCRPGDSASEHNPDVFDYYKSNIISYLRWYLYGSQIRITPKNYTDENTAEKVIAAYGDYYDFLQSIAISMSSQPGLTPVNQFLARYYARPDTAMLKELNGGNYNGTVLQENYERAFVKSNRISGFQVALTSGAWVPQGNLSVLGNHPYFGMTIGGRSNKFMYDLNGSYRWVDAPRNYSVVYNDTSYQNKYYQGAYIGLDLGYELCRKKKNEIDLLGGIAYDGFNDVFNNGNTTVIFPSLNLNIGLGYKILLRHVQKSDYDYRSYITLQAKFNYLDYKNPGGTDISGNALNFGLVYGFYYKALHYYYSIP